MKLSKIFQKKSTFLSIHNKSKLTRMNEPLKEYPTIWSKIFYKEYPRYPRIFLPTPEHINSRDIFQVILQRESKRKFNKTPLLLQDISLLLFFSAGINRLEKSTFPKRTYPSAGARYPLEIYVVVTKNISKLKAGIYHYHVKLHALELINGASYPFSLENIISGVNKEMGKNAPVFLVVSAVFGRTEIKYGRTTYKHVLLETGFLGQNVYLVSTALGLDCCMLGGFIDEKMNEFLDLDIEKEQAICAIALGKNK